MQSWDIIATAVVAYLLGIATGFYGCRYIAKINFKIDGMDSRNFVIFIISLGWIASVLIEVINPAFKTNVALHGLMGAIVGYFFQQKSK